MRYKTKDGDQKLRFKIKQSHLSHPTPIKPRSFSLAFPLFLCLLFLLASSSVFAGNRIISLIPSSTELICAIGFQDELVAVSNFCNYPLEVTEKLPKIGDQNLNIEKILSLKPSILIDTNSIHKRYEALFKRLKLNYVNVDIKSQSDIPFVAVKLSELLGNKEKCKSFVDNWEKELSNLESVSNSKVKVYMEIWNNPIQAVGGNNNIDSIISIAGGENVLSKQKDYPIVNLEMILVQNPDIIFLAYPEADIEAVKNRLGWKNIKAVKNNNVYAINQDTIVRPSPRNLEAVRTINQIINKVIANEK